VLPVSLNLKLAMEKHRLLNKNYFVINNTVNTCFFTKHPIAERNIKRILRVSSFDERAKNIKGILNAVEKLAHIRTDFELVLIGHSKEYDLIYNYSKQLCIPEGIIAFYGEKNPEQVAIEMNNADFFVLFSNFENSPVVISESLCCGKPVVSTNVGGISEHINETNGILIPAGNEQALTDSLNYMLDHFQEYNSALIQQQSIEKYSMHSVGAKLYSMYQQILEN
jgi:glycosyltransferase involved in cell wall biosynthesis